ncbi:MAG: hypothetical protein RMJ98_03290, partial [Myxococcales bacterium]|nr:hypothetical protein [Myxococcales bacterium]
MRHLTLPTLRLVLRDLLEKRRADLLLSRAGTFHEPELSEILASMDALPPSLSGMPLAEELKAADDRHDAYGSILFFLTEAYLRHPDAPDEILAAARRIREAFLPHLGELNASYAQEADRALERKRYLAERKEDLLLFPMAGGKTLLDVATAYLEAGEHLHKLLSDRADIPRGQRQEASTLRPRAIGALSRLRRDLVAEIKKNQALPRDLEDRIFAYLDAL